LQINVVRLVDTGGSKYLDDDLTLLDRDLA
jgi:hypothetical protein